MANRWQFARSTAAAMVALNPILREGELVFETDTLRYKIGDGVTSWNSLSFREFTGDFNAMALNDVADPTTPLSTQAYVYIKSVAGRMMLKVKGPTGLDTPLQPLFGQNNIIMIRPAVGATLSVFGTGAPSIGGAASTPTLSNYNFRTSIRRTNIASAATANSTANVRIPVNTVWRGDNPGLGGFFFQCRFSFNSAVANQQSFVGLWNTLTAPGGTQVPSALTNVIGLSYDAADSNLQLIRSSGGAAVKIDLGANFPARSTTVVYELTIFCAPNDTKVTVRTNNLTTGETDTSVLTSSIPAQTTFLTYHAFVNNGGTALACSIDLIGLYIETDN